jgi:hypothetical protein
VHVYRACEQLSEVVIYFTLIFSPWAFGTTQPWSIWTMNSAGYLLGMLLAVKLLIRWFRRYQPGRWFDPVAERAASSGGYRQRLLTASRLTAALALLTLLLLGYSLVSAVNARATFQDQTLTFAYHECVRWLPHSLDSAASWSSFWMYLGLAGAFWAVRDWLLGKASGEERAQWQKAGALGGGGTAPPLPTRFRRLLWVLAINGALLGCEAIVQRSANSPRLLFLVLPRVHVTADAQFGPYAYRSNAAQYFNLLWPVCLGFWWTLNRNSTRRRKTHNALFAAAAVMAACPIISTSRAGAFVTFAVALLAVLTFFVTHLLSSGRRGETSQSRTRTPQALTIFFGGALGLGLVLGWDALKPRLTEFNQNLETREQMYEAARQMAADYPLFGIGPGSYEMVSQLYPHPEEFWAQLHNDWLETRITFGWAGSALIALALVSVLLRWRAHGGIHGGRRFVILTWLALGGCLLHARFDFPFQIHSTLYLFLLLCAMLSTLSRRPGRAPSS